MKKVKYFIFSLICLFSCSIVFAKDEVVIKSITPVYDETSTIDAHVTYMKFKENIDLEETEKPSKEECDKPCKGDKEGKGHKGNKGPKQDKEEVLEPEEGTETEEEMLQ